MPERVSFVASMVDHIYSLLITTDDLYTQYLHGIAETTLDEDLGPERIANWNVLGAPDVFTSGCVQREARISLTYRDVLKVSQISNKLRLFNRT